MILPASMFADSADRLVRWLLALCIGVLATASAQAQSLLPVPELTARVIDQTATLQPGQLAALEARLAALERDKGAQLVMLMVPTTTPEDIAAYANRVGNAWKIGRAGVGDGLLVVVARDDRRMRIEVAKTLEGAVPDIAASRIINDVMAPFFRAGDYAGGLEAAFDQLDARIRDEPLPPVQAPGATGDDEGSWLGLIAFLLLGLPISGAFARSHLGNRKGSLVTGALFGLVVLLATGSILVALLAAVVGTVLARAGVLESALDSGYGGGYPGGPVHLPGRSGGGGFGSGGGGNFGGGGASGRW